jgi:hypothetical protein
MALVTAAFLVQEPAAVVLVRAGDDLQRALDAARPGDTIMLEAGATFSGNFVLPARHGGDSRVVTLRTAHVDGLPGEGARVSPADAPRLAKLRSPNGRPALRTAPGAKGWHIALLEILGTPNGAGDIVALGDGSTAQKTLSQVPSYLTLDRLYIHGDPVRGQKRAIALNSSHTTIRGCYVADIMAVGQDSQAIGGWNGPGPYLIENNHLEAAGENILFGGADPSIIGLTPETIVVRENTLTKPLAWREPGAPRWQVKNLLELKNARRVIVERNVMERSWQQAQAGYAVLFTVRNQDGGCPWCQVEDVTFRHNIVRDVAAGIQILGVDPNAPSRQTRDIVIRDNLFDGIDRSAWGGDGYFLQLTDGPRDITVDHNTIIQRASGGLVKMSGVTDRFTFTNNIASHGRYGFMGTDRGIGEDSIRAYLPGALITRNVMAGGPRNRYPPGNLFPSPEEFARQFAGMAEGNYALASASAWREAGLDGRDLGADVSALPSPPWRDPASRRPRTKRP